MYTTDNTESNLTMTQSDIELFGAIVLAHVNNSRVNAEDNNKSARH
jgi:hypothetical protein